MFYSNDRYGWIGCVVTTIDMEERDLEIAAVLDTLQGKAVMY